MEKKKLKQFILVLIGILGLVFIIRDWYVFFYCHQKIDCIHHLSYFQYVTKFTITLLTAFLTLIIGKNCISRPDRQLIQLAFIGAVCADFCFKILLHWNIFPIPIDFTHLGIFLFIVVQAFLIVRHSRLSAFDKHIPKALLIPCIIFIINLIFVLTSVLSIKTGLLLSYASFLFASVITAWKAPLNGFFPKKNGILIRWGMIFFLLCDIQIALSSSLNTFNGPIFNTMGLIANNLVWLFYVPALVLLSLSGFRSTRSFF